MLRRSSLKVSKLGKQARLRNNRARIVTRTNRYFAVPALKQDPHNPRQLSSSCTWPHHQDPWAFPPPLDMAYPKPSNHSISIVFSDDTKDNPPSDPPSETTPETPSDESQSSQNKDEPSLSGGGSDNTTQSPVSSSSSQQSSNSGGGHETYSMKPSEMISELNRFVIGQNNAKKAVAIAWRARWRRRRLPEDFKPEVTPKNILMMGPTGCGKTEVARRLAKLSDSPFVKIEATKFTEVGYVGKDVNTIIEDLVAHAATLVKERKKKELFAQLNEEVNNTLQRSLLGKLEDRESEYWKKKLEDGTLDDMSVEIDVQKEPDLSSLFRGRNPYFVLAGGDGAKTEKKTYPIRRAREILMEQELKKHLSDTDLATQAVELAENDGIVFIDEIDKICASRDSFRGDRKVSQEGVQRDLLPLIEGCSVQVQNYGKVNTDHILFICAGAFHDSKPSDLMPEFQGRLPVRVELEPLTKDDLLRILRETEFNLIIQQIEMLKTERCALTFTDEAIEAVADAAVKCNDRVENIGARRLITVIEKVMEDINVEASESANEYTIDKDYVEDHLGDIYKGEDYDKFIL